MSGRFTIDGPLVRFSQLELVSDGSRSDITGVVDMAHWPEQTWNVKSLVQFPRMREIFFARERWRLGRRGPFHRRLPSLQGRPRSVRHVHEPDGAA